MKTEQSPRRLWAIIWFMFIAVMLEVGLSTWAAWKANEYRTERDYWKNQALENARYK